MAASIIALTVFFGVLFYGTWRVGKKDMQNRNYLSNYHKLHEWE